MNEEATQQAINALPQAFRELQAARSVAETVNRRSGVLRLTLTAEHPHGIPMHFHLAGEEAALVLAALPAIAQAAVAERAQALTDLVERIRADLS